ncbi:MAG: hypothetical protein AB7I41_10155 [Candidatus Sericytochromatia bacterium]
MFQCDQCNGFIPTQLKTCPNCQSVLKSSFRHRLKRASQLVLGASIAMTLSACYGTPPPLPLPDCNDLSEKSKEPCAKPSPTGSPSASPSPSPVPTGSPSA